MEPEAYNGNTVLCAVLGFMLKNKRIDQENPDSSKDQGDIHKRKRKEQKQSRKLITSLHVRWAVLMVNTERCA
jgi:hypothetical protein